LHGPADLRIAVIGDAEWDFAAWLPHTNAHERVLVAGPHTDLRPLFSALAGDARPHTIVVATDPALLAHRATAVRRFLASTGSVIVIGSPLPSLCAYVIEVAADMSVRVSEPAATDTTTSCRGAGMSLSTASARCAQLARYADPEADDRAGLLPARVS